jgi:hypothetical protein
MIKMGLALYLLYMAIKVFIESIYTFKCVLKSNNFKTLKSPIIKFLNMITFISIIYFLLQFRWFYTGLYTELEDIDEILWSVLEGTILFTIANVCSILRKLSRFTEINYE